METQPPGAFVRQNCNEHHLIRCKLALDRAIMETIYLEYILDETIMELFDRSTLKTEQIRKYP
jgi:hypothetical protein